MDNLYYEKCVSWLTLLKSAVEVFNGTITGFSDISDEKQDRAKELLPSMKRILMDIIESLLKERTEEDPSTYMEQTIIKTAIEFCLHIKA